MAEFRVPVVVEVILERVTNISMGTELTTSSSSRTWPSAGGRPHRHRCMLD